MKSDTSAQNLAKSAIPVPAGRILRVPGRPTGPTASAAPVTEKSRPMQSLPQFAASAFGVGILFAVGVVFGMSGPAVQALQEHEVVVVASTKPEMSINAEARSLAAVYKKATYERDVYTHKTAASMTEEARPVSLRLLAESVEALPSTKSVKREQAVAATPRVFRTEPPKAPASTLRQRVLKIIQLHAPKHTDPKTLADRIVKESVAQNYDPLFVAAVIKSESGFNSLARSHVGARGLMQIMPATGTYMAGKLKIKKVRLYDCDQNLRLGIAFLKELEASYDGDKVMTLVAYNWGPGHVEMAGKGKRRIPGEVMRYAVKILNDYRRWRGDVPAPTAIG